MFVFNKLNRFICIRLSNANKIQTINPEIMNKTTRLLGSLLIITIATSCGTGGKNQSAQTDDPLANSPIVGQYVQAGTDKVMSCDQKLLADTVRIPLSFFTEKLEIVKLDNRDAITPRFTAGFSVMRLKWKNWISGTRHWSDKPG